MRYLGAMTDSDERALFERYSRGDISRSQLARRLGRELPFGEALQRLGGYGLPLAQSPAGVESFGVQLIKNLALRNGAR